MKRLRDTHASGPLAQRAQALLDAEPPLPESAERMRRVRSALDRPRARGRWLRVPAFAVCAAVLLLGASAFAAVRIYEAVERRAQAARAEAHAAEAARNARRARGAAPHASAAGGEQAAAERAPAAAPAVELGEGASMRADGEVAPSLEAAPALAREAAASQPSPRGRGARDGVAARGSRERVALASERGAATRRASGDADADTTREAAASPSPQAAPASDSELVHRAAKALRRDGDPALAARLLREHRARGLRGPLAEEVLALQIEAALALRSKEAAALSREYLGRYPEGRYAGIARRALSEAAP